MMDISSVLSKLVIVKKVRPNKNIHSQKASIDDVTTCFLAFTNLSDNMSLTVKLVLK